MLKGYFSMDDSEKISGKRIFSILEKLKEKHTILNVHVMGTDFEGLSVIVDFFDGDNPRFIIDYPGTHGSDPGMLKGKKCYIEFSGEDKIPYSFKTTIDKISEKRIIFHFPEFIERTQRRRTFRISVPSETKMFYTHRNKQLEFDVIDISEGGLLAGIKAIHHESLILFKGSKLYNLLISAVRKDISVNIKVTSAEIVRLEHIKETARFKYGLKFIDINNEEMNLLKRFIYYCQRRLLKKR